MTDLTSIRVVGLGMVVAGPSFPFTGRLHCISSTDSQFRAQAISVPLLAFPSSLPSILGRPSGQDLSVSWLLQGSSLKAAWLRKMEPGS